MFRCDAGWGHGCWVAFQEKCCNGFSEVGCWVESINFGGLNAGVGGCGTAVDPKAGGGTFSRSFQLSIANSAIASQGGGRLAFGHLLHRCFIGVDNRGRQGFRCDGLGYRREQIGGPAQPVHDGGTRQFTSGSRHPR